MPPKCAECGMWLYNWREYHTVEACECFKQTHDENAVRALMLERKAAERV